MSTKSNNDNCFARFLMESLFSLRLLLLAAGAAVMLAFAYYEWLVTDTYTAEIVVAEQHEAANGNAETFVWVKPSRAAPYLWGLNQNGYLKLAVRDSFMPYRYTRDSSRASGLVDGDTVCVTDHGFRLPLRNKYPNIIRVTRGYCNQ
jgi:hypothetical protein